MCVRGGGEGGRLEMWSRGVPIRGPRGAGAAHGSGSQDGNRRVGHARGHTAAAARPGGEAPVDAPRSSRRARAYLQPLRSTREQRRSRGWIERWVPSPRPPGRRELPRRRCGDTSGTVFNPGRPAGDPGAAGSRTSPGPGPGVHGTVTSLSIHAQTVVQPEARTRQAGAGGLGLRQSPGESWPPSRIQTRTC